ncbi:hypothetical protein [Candidatus Accumulibacter phosphatis]
MYRLHSRADFAIFFFVSVAVGSLGALMLLYPLERLPEDPQAYRLVRGVLKEVKDESPRRGTWVLFSLTHDETVFVASTPPAREESKAWVVGSTTLQFFVQKQSAANLEPVPAYGIKTDTHQVKSLEKDIAFHNAGVNPWAGLMALAIGTLGFVIAVVCYVPRYLELFNPSHSRLR